MHRARALNRASSVKSDPRGASTPQCSLPQRGPRSGGPARFWNTRRSAAPNLSRLARSNPPCRAGCPRVIDAARLGARGSLAKSACFRERSCPPRAAPLRFRFPRRAPSTGAPSPTLPDPPPCPRGSGHPGHAPVVRVVGWDRLPGGEGWERARHAGRPQPACPPGPRGRGIPWSVRPLPRRRPGTRALPRDVRGRAPRPARGGRRRAASWTRATVPLGPDTSRSFLGRAAGRARAGRPLCLPSGTRTWWAFGASPLDAGGRRHRAHARRRCRTRGARGLRRSVGHARRGGAARPAPPGAGPARGAGGARHWSEPSCCPFPESAAPGSAWWMRTMARCGPSTTAATRGSRADPAGVGTTGMYPRAAASSRTIPCPYARVTVNGSLGHCQQHGPVSPATRRADRHHRADESHRPHQRLSAGPSARAVTCDANDRPGANAGSNCSVGPGASAGNTKASRSCFYAVNRLKEHARPGGSPATTGLNNVQTTVNTNVNSTCNATWDGSSLNMYRAGIGLRQHLRGGGAASHEWGHGMDQNDGGGFDNSSEAYGDISEFLTDHTSCVGRGFFRSGACSGYGDTCLTCTGIRDMDWAARVLEYAGHTGGLHPALPQRQRTLRQARSTARPTSPARRSGTSPPATCPLPGSTRPAAWQLTDRLWYCSRPGSGGNMYTCALPDASGCGPRPCSRRMRAADDDDDEPVNNGTPHAAAIFAACNRHGIACGLAATPATRAAPCPALAAAGPDRGGGCRARSSSTGPRCLGPRSYRVLRNDVRLRPRVHDSAPRPPPPPS